MIASDLVSQPFCLVEYKSDILSDSYLNLSYLELLKVLRGMKTKRSKIRQFAWRARFANKTLFNNHLSMNLQQNYESFLAFIVST